MAEKYWGVAIPGLAMNAAELPEIPGLLRLDNPEVGPGVSIGRFYSLEEVAEIHALKIRQLPTEEGPFVISGMSMGGMIGSILGTLYRHFLPKLCEFRLMVTTANEEPALAMPVPFILRNVRIALQTEWALKPFVERLFSEYFVEKHPDVVAQYTRYHAQKKNLQSAIGFIRQVSAIQHFKGKQYFSKLSKDEAKLIHGKGDRLVTPDHAEVLKKIAPHLLHIELEGVGHMVNFEVPSIFQKSI